MARLEDLRAVGDLLDRALGEVEADDVALGHADGGGPAVLPRGEGDFPAAGQGGEPLGLRQVGGDTIHVGLRHDVVGLLPLLAAGEEVLVGLRFGHGAVERAVGRHEEVVGMVVEGEFLRLARPVAGSGCPAALGVEREGEPGEGPLVAAVVAAAEVEDATPRVAADAEDAGVAREGHAQGAGLLGLQVVLNDGGAGVGRLVLWPRHREVPPAVVGVLPREVDLAVHLEGVAVHHLGHGVGAVDAPEAADVAEEEQLVLPRVEGEERAAFAGVVGHGAEVGPAV